MASTSCRTEDFTRPELTSKVRLVSQLVLCKDSARLPIICQIDIFQYRARIHGRLFDSMPVQSRYTARIYSYHKVAYRYQNMRTMMCESHSFYRMRFSCAYLWQQPEAKTSHLSACSNSLKIHSMWNERGVKERISSLVGFTENKYCPEDPHVQIETAICAVSLTRSQGAWKN